LTVILVSAVLRLTSAVRAVMVVFR
jgi:hypothetical protein